MGGKTKQKSSSTSTYTPTAQASAAYTNVLNQAANAANTGYNPATQTNVAGFTPQQLQAFQGINAASGNYQPLLDQATSMAQGAGQAITPEQIAAYQNPYTQQVIDATMADMNRNNAIQQSQLRGNQIAASPWANYGNRTGVAQAELAKGQNMNMANTISGLRQQGYTQALGAAQNDATRGLQASGQLGNLAGMTQNMSMTDLMAQLGIGNQQQALTQQQNDAATTNAQQETMWPYQNAQWLASIASAIGPLTGGTTTGKQTSTTSQGKGAGSIIGAGLSLMSMFSDRRMKEDVHQIGQTFDGQPIYKFRYKGSPKTQIGLMAQNVEQSHPDAVSEGPGGFKMVDYDRATDGAEMANGGGVGSQWFDAPDLQAASPIVPQLPAPPPPPAEDKKGGGLPGLDPSSMGGLMEMFGGMFAKGGGVGGGGFGGSSWFSMPELKAAQPIIPQLQQAPSSGGGGQQDSFDPAKSIQLGKSAGAGLENIIKSMDSSKGWGASIENGSDGQGFGGIGNALSSLFGGFAAGGGVDWMDAFPDVDPITGRIRPKPRVPHQEVGMGELAGSAVPMEGPGAAADSETAPPPWLLDALGKAAAAEGAGAPVGMEGPGAAVGAEAAGPPVDATSREVYKRPGFGEWLQGLLAPKDESGKLSFDGGGFGMYGRPMGPPAPPAGSPFSDMLRANEARGKEFGRKLGMGDQSSRLDFDGGGFGLYGRGARSAPDDSEAASNMFTGVAGAPSEGGFSEGVPPAGWGPATETHGAAPGLSTTDFIKQEESWHKKPKWDNSQWTNGWGTRASGPDDHIDKAEADRRLDKEIGEIDTWLDRNVKVQMSPSQRTALTSFAFNGGTGWLQKLLPDINKGDWDRVGDRMLSFNKAYNPKTGQKEPMLTARRTREVALIKGKSDPYAAPAVGSGGPGAGGVDLGSASPASGTPAPSIAKAKDPEAPVVSGYSSPADKAGGGLLKRWFGIDFNPLKLSEDERMAMLAAGLGMMKNGNVGEGGLMGMQYLRDKQGADREAAFKAQELAMRLEQIRKPDFGQIGTDQYGMPQMGFIDKTGMKVTPASGSPAGVGLEGGDFEQYPELVKEKAKRIVAGLEGMPSPGRDKTANMVGAAVRTLDPTYNANRFKFRQDWESPSKRASITRVANNTAIKHAGELSDLVDALPDTGIKALNAAKNWWQGETTDPALLQYRSVASLLADEITKVMVPTGGTLHDRQEQLEKLNPANGRKAINGVLAQYTKVLADKTKSLETEWNKVMGDKAEAPDVIDEEAKGAADRLRQRYYGEGGGGGHAAGQPSEDEVLSEAAKAIRAGKDANAVRERVKKMGFDPSKIQL